MGWGREWREVSGVTLAFQAGGTVPRGEECGRRRGLGWGMDVRHTVPSGAGGLAQEESEQRWPGAVRQAALRWEGVQGRGQQGAPTFTQGKESPGQGEPSGRVGTGSPRSGPGDAPRGLFGPCLAWGLQRLCPSRPPLPGRAL